MIAWHFSDELAPRRPQTLHKIDKKVREEELFLFAKAFAFSSFFLIFLIGK